jgi:hypothetical protein
MLSTHPDPTPTTKHSFGRNFRWQRSTILLCLFLSLVTYAVAKPLLRLQVPRPEVHAAQSRANLERIGLALRSYHDKYDSLPPAYVSDSQGNKLYSWRVLLLPFLGEDELFAAFHKDKAWDSPENLALMAQMPRVFALPGNSSCGCGYYAVTGRGTAFERGETIRISEIADGASLTIGVVELRGLTRSWAEPFDLNLDDCRRVIGGRLGQLPGPDLSLTFQAVMFDGSVPTFWYPPEKCLRAMATISGDEALDPIEAEMLGQPPRDRWFAWEFGQTKKSPW